MQGVCRVFSCSRLLRAYTCFSYGAVAQRKNVSHAVQLQNCACLRLGTTQLGCSAACAGAAAHVQLIPQQKQYEGGQSTNAVEVSVSVQGCGGEPCGVCQAACHPHTHL